MTGKPDLAIFLATSGHSGVDRLMKNLIAEFCRRGLRVDLLQIRGHGPYFEKTPEGLNLVDLGTSHVNSSFLPLVTYLKETAPPVLLVDKDRLIRNALLARRTAGVDSRIVIRIGTTVSVNLARRRRLDRLLQKLSIRRLYPSADAIIMPSAGAAQDLAAFGKLPLERISVLPNPVVDARLHQLAGEPLNHPWFVAGQPPVFLSVGELCGRKDFETLIRAFAEVHKQASSRLMILGEGRRREGLERLVADLGLQDDVALPGFVDNPYPYMKHAALFVLSSQCEGFGLVIAEALALGTPVVSTDCPSGPREILRDGEFGRLVAVGDDQALGRAMLETLENPPPVDILRQAAEPFNVSSSADRYLEVLGVDADR